jgi:16S rRNA G966 N2-methylase RsmD
MVFRRLRENVTNLCGQEVVGGDLLRCVRADVCGFLDGTAGEFDIIFADPPYDKRRVKRGVALVTQVLELILRSGRLAESGLVVLEQGADEALPEAAGWRLVRERRYGGSCLRFFVPDSEPSVEEGL